MPQLNEPEKASIDNLISQFFGIFNNKANSEHNWELIFSICIPETIIVKKNGLEQTVYNLKDFIEPRKKILTDGTISNFEEYETEEETVIINNIAQRKSRYQKTGYLKNVQFTESGTKLFHLIKTSKGWQISSVMWEDDQS
ncbi:MAG: hypothetical protein JO301_16415 [Chitinophagaceae bacterium]|nr:hypothetical protein [Chitinophagaceae bacterium]